MESARAEALDDASYAGGCHVLRVENSKGVAETGAGTVRLSEKPEEGGRESEEERGERRRAGVFERIAYQSPVLPPTKITDVPTQPVA